MARPEWEALYGGAAGGGKSEALVMEALRQVGIPHYKGLILRKTYTQLGELVDKTLLYYPKAYPRERHDPHLALPLRGADHLREHGAHLRPHQIPGPGL